MVSRILNKKKDFENLYQKGVLVRTSGMSFRYLNNGNKKLRCAYRVSKKNVKKAFQRNKLKRWGRFVLKQNPQIQKLHIDLLMNFHFFWDEYSEFKKNMEKLLKKIHQK